MQIRIRPVMRWESVILPCVLDSEEDLISAEVNEGLQEMGHQIRRSQEFDPKTLIAFSQPRSLTTPFGFLLARCLKPPNSTTF